MAAAARYVHTNLVARDWKRLAQFYIRVFGCRPKPPERDLRGEWLDRLTGTRRAHIRGIHLALPGCGPRGPTLEIFQYARASRGGASRVDGPGFRHVAFAVSDVKATLARVQRNGGSRVGDRVSAEIAGVGRIDVVYARDPEGNIIELQKWATRRA